jgi:lysophospholipase L1-like esterase
MKRLQFYIVLMLLMQAGLFLFGQTKTPAVKPVPQQVLKDTLRYKKNPTYALQQAMFDIYKTRQADVVMFGNSLTHGAAWNELLGRSNVVERGIPADGLYGYEARINSIYKLNPKIVFIMGGLNDIYSWTPVEDIFAVYIRIIKGLKSKNIIPVIQSTTYATKTYGKDWGGTPEGNFGRNREVDKLNKLLSDYARKNNIDYVDINSLTATKDGFLNPDLTYDGIHFKAEAFKIWGHEIDKVLIKHRL